MSTLCNRGVAAWWLAALLIVGTSWAQPEVPPAEPPAVPPVEGVPEGLPEEAAEELEDIFDEIEDDLEDTGRDLERRGVERSDRQRRAREIREQVRQKVREASSRSDSKVSFGSSVRIDEDEVVRDVVTIGGSIDIEGTVSGDAVAVGGSIDVDGRVAGDLVAVGGGVRIGPNAEILGEVTSIGGEVIQDEGAEVLGNINEVSVATSLWNWDFDDADTDWDWGRGPSFWRFGLRPGVELGWGLTGIFMLALLACLVQLIGGDTVERVRSKAVATPFVAGLVGLAVQLLFVPALVLLCLILTLSIIGIPLLLLIPFVVLAMLLAFLVGYTGAAMAVGRWFERRFGLRFESPFVALLVGVGVVQGLSFVGDVLELLPGFLQVFSFMFGIAGFLIKYAAWTIGLGGVFLAGFRRSPTAASPMLPPVPPAPTASGGTEPGTTGDAPGSAEGS